MANNLETRILALEQSAADTAPIEPVPIFILPEEGDPDRARIQGEIDALELAGKLAIVMVRVDARVNHGEA
ncbi:MAG: hypothetical protein Q8O64_12865 [Sideroxyarcus sp.]|nr:hypothetical protein [Sideroxyarcus sp.]